MKQQAILLAILLSLLTACRKTTTDQPIPNPVNKDFSLDAVKAWYARQPQNRSLTVINWDGAEYRENGGTTYWLTGISGQPIFQGIRQGYRRAAFYRDTTQQIREQILEIIPDGLTLQRKGNLPANQFTGRIFVYSPDNRLLHGGVYAAGKLIGLIRSRAPQDTGKLKTNLLAVDCTWYQDAYADGDGGVTVYAEKVCNYELDGGASGGFSAGVPASTGGIGGGSAPNLPPAPVVSNLPGESGPAVNPKNLMLCFGSIPDQGATMTITVYVQEPFPGTSFNIGPNSVGHTAIGMTKSNGQNSVTQVFGFYPDATGLDKLHASSKIALNNALDYNVSITYTVTADNFNKIVNYVSNPPPTYDLVTFNCTSFAFYACQAGQISLPDPTTVVGLLGPGIQPHAMTPAGLGEGLDNLQDAANLNKNGGITPLSKGPCN
ncbi:hypothetical protein [Mucilaginibacter sp. SG564]|uniref:hypothetical protein n=1 Tax=Mucilaginibacter sp. SG564 TaxID=2587022 RepID=UPI001552604A|nr:hypothetical protein [Mucilaginibacter sp. SG564]NOW95861.1 hypothetical protein [Mucilaginibacter sp. SG564]